jgi:hypothetical protein
MVVRERSFEVSRPHATSWMAARVFTIFLFLFYISFTALHLFEEPHLMDEFASEGHSTVDSDHHHDSDHDHDHKPHVASDHSFQALLKAGSVSVCPVFIVTDVTIPIEPPTIYLVATFVDCMGPPPKAIPDPLQPRAPPLS